MTLDEFMKSSFHNAWVKFPGVKSLYVRKSTRILGGTIRECVDIASIEVQKPGRGTWKRLLSHLLEMYPDQAIFIENVHNERFATHLREYGWTPHEYLPGCYYQT